MSHRRAVTLVETLVACALVALLCALVVPAADNARSDAQQTLCAKRLGDLARACQAYAAQDTKERILPVGRGDASFFRVSMSFYGFGGKSGKGTALAAGLSDFGGGVYLDSSNRPLNRILYKTPLPVAGQDIMQQEADAQLNVQEYHCPNDAGFPGNHIRGWQLRGGSSYNYFGTSYIANPMFVMAAPGGDGSVYSNALHGRAQSGIPNPAKTVLVWENAALFAIISENPAYDHGGCSWPYNWNAESRGWHGDPFHFNIAAADGSVRYLEMRGFQPPAEPLLPDTCPVGNCACVAVRGLDWQLDTLPAQPILTNKHATSAAPIVTNLGGGTDYELVE